ncbi:unnamed protein product [Caenorhabditis sp. 36 PRJEB53466]|nr:unnamed protein product [Caenorhabditis sp. 36 PRJEB53466]
MVLMSTPPPVYGSSRKTSQEKKRRDEINAKIKELQQLIQQDSDHEKMTQGDVLMRAVELVNRMESESPDLPSIPIAKDSMTDSLRLNHKLTRSSEAWELTQKSSLVVSSTPQTSPHGRMKSKDGLDTERASSSSSPSNSEAGHHLDRKEVKKNREQDRRDRQGEAFEALKHFIIANKLMTSQQVEKMQRLNTLDIIISYIRNKKNNFVSRSGQEQTLYNHALAEGKKTGRLTAFSFFKSDRHLVVRCSDLEKFLEFSNNPKPLLGFPRLPSITPPTALQLPISPFPMAPMFPFRPFPLFPLVVPTPPSQQSPAYSLDSPPPSSDTSSSSLESSSTPNENSNTPCTKKLFRPWE